MTRILVGNALERLRELPDESVHCVVTSPPYWGLRSYEKDAGFWMIGLEPTFDEHLRRLVAVFREVRRVLRSDGTLWLNYGDAYNTGTTAGRQPTKTADVRGWQREAAVGPRVNDPRLKAKNLMMMPARVALALQADGWWLRSEVVWHKPNPMPESCTDRPTSSHEKLYLLAKRATYFYDAEAVRVPHAEPWRGKGESDSGATDDRGRHDAWKYSKREYNPSGANLRNVWSIPTESFPGAHFATMPQKLVEPCIRAGTSKRGVCAQCGAPWVRETNTTHANPGNRTTNGARSVENRAATAGFAVRLEKRVETTGWRPSCECTPQTGLSVPATVLDPFGGAGTVALVAQRLQRYAILCEISPTYAEMAEKRIRDEAPLFAEVASA